MPMVLIASTGSYLKIVMLLVVKGCVVDVCCCWLLLGA
jgi:hypothetical protein